MGSDIGTYIWPQVWKSIVIVSLCHEEVQQGILAEENNMIIDYFSKVIAFKFE